MTIRELAKETGRATEDIAQRVNAIQSETTTAAASITAITEIIDQMSHIQTTIAGAVEEQTATTGEIARSVTSAAQGVESITEKIHKVAAHAEESSAGAQQTEHAAAELSSVATALGATQTS